MIYCELHLIKVNKIFSNFFFSGQCCIQNVIITIIDKDEFFDQCNLIVSEIPLTVVQYPTTTETLEETTTAEETSPIVETTIAEETTPVLETTATEETTPAVETTTLEQVTAYVTSIEKHTFTGLGKAVRLFFKYLFHISIRTNLNYSVKAYDDSPELVTIAFMVIYVFVLL